MPRRQSVSRVVSTPQATGHGSAENIVSSTTGEASQPGGYPALDEFVPETPYAMPPYNMNGQLSTIYSDSSAEARFAQNNGPIPLSFD